MTNRLLVCLLLVALAHSQYAVQKWTIEPKQYGDSFWGKCNKDMSEGISWRDMSSKLNILDSTATYQIVMNRHYYKNMTELKVVYTEDSWISFSTCSKKTTYNQDQFNQSDTTLIIREGNSTLTLQLYNPAASVSLKLLYLFVLTVGLLVLTFLTPQTSQSSSKVTGLCNSFGYTLNIMVTLCQFFGGFWITEGIMAIIFLLLPIPLILSLIYSWERSGLTGRQVDRQIFTMLLGKGMWISPRVLWLVSLLASMGFPQVFTATVIIYSLVPLLALLPCLRQEGKTGWNSASLILYAFNILLIAMFKALPITPALLPFSPTLSIVLIAISVTVILVLLLARYGLRWWRMVCPKRQGEEGKELAEVAASAENWLNDRTCIMCHKQLMSADKLEGEVGPAGDYRPKIMKTSGGQYVHRQCWSSCLNVNYDQLK